MLKTIIYLCFSILLVFVFVSYQCFAGGKYCASSPAEARQQVLQQSPESVIHEESALEDERSVVDIPSKDSKHVALRTETSHYFFDANNHITRLEMEAGPLSSGSSQSNALPNENIVHINTDDVATIDRILAGIGKTKAQAIVDYRNIHGAFKQIEDLEQVKGIGAATIAKNRQKIVLD